MADRYAGKAIMVKAKAMYSRWLKEQDYKELLRKESIDEIAAFLKQRSHYTESLHTLSESNVPRVELENLLRKDIFSRYLDFMRYDRSAHSFYRFVIAEMEVEQLVTCLRYLRSGNIERLIVDLPGFLFPYAQVDFIRLAGIKSFAEMLAVLRHTPYYEVLLPHRPTEGQSLDQAACEAALQHYLAEHMLRLIQTAALGEDRARLSRFYREQVELSNLNLIFRLKSFERIPGTRVRSYLVPLYGILSASLVKQLVETRDRESFLDLLRQTTLGRQLGDLSSVTLTGATYFDLFTTRLHYQKCRRLLSFAQEGPSAFLAFIMLNRIELRNLITLIEGTRYHISPEELAPLLVY